MKNLLKINLFTYLLTAGIFLTQVSCSTTARQQASAASEEAYNDFKNYVTSVEKSTATAADKTAADWESASAAAKATYNEKVSRLDSYSDSWSEEQKQEIADLKTRYNTYWENQEANYRASTSMMGNSRNGGIVADYNTSGLSILAATEIRAAYENFVRKVQENKESYKREDWLTINTYYEALDARREAVKDELTDNDKYEIGKAKAKYAAIKASGVATPYVKEAASEVKDATKTGAKKVGNAAEKVGSEIKSTTKKGVNKVDQKLDDMRD